MKWLQIRCRKDRRPVSADSSVTSFVIGKNSGRGKSSKCRNPKTCKNCLVVPYSNGRPNSSDRPTIRTKSRSISCRRTSPHCTPRIASISARNTGCRYATTAKVSRAGAESRTSRDEVAQSPQPRRVTRPRQQLISSGNLLHSKRTTLRIISPIQGSDQCTGFCAVRQASQLGQFSTS